MFKYENLLRNEYFPSELPPCFDSQMLANNWKEIQNIISTIHFDKTSEPMTFSGYKNSKARRKFAVPNPYHYCKTIAGIVDNTNKIYNIFAKSKASLTKPKNTMPKKNECYSKLTNSIAESKLIIEQLYQNNLFEIRLDIASFFDSIYTHSISWAIHTKSVAKKINLFHYMEMYWMVVYRR